METSTDRPVVIVGAGLAGLSCARSLQDAGVPYQIFEAADAVGGRIRTDEIDGFKCDRGFQVLLTAYPEAQRQLDYAALDLKTFLPGALIRKGGRFHRFVDPWRRPMDGIRSVFGGVGTVGDKLKVAKLRSRATRGTVEELFGQPETSAEDALRGYGFGEEMIDGFFRSFFGGIFLERELRTSSRMLHFVFRMFSIGDAALPSAGMQAIPEQMAGRLNPNCLRLNASVQSVACDSVVLADGRQVEASKVVVATNAFCAAELLGQSAQKSSRRVQCVYFAASKPPITEAILVLNGDGDGPINNLCVPTNSATSYAPPDQHLISISVLDGMSDTAEELVSAIRKQATSWFGNSVESWRHLKTYDIPQALPDQLVGKNAKPGCSLDANGIVVCGDHIGNSSIQSALESGVHAAQALSLNRAFS